MLMANDAQLHQVTTPLGTVNFVQVCFSNFLSASFLLSVILLICTCRLIIVTDLNFMGNILFEILSYLTES